MYSYVHADLHSICNFLLELPTVTLDKNLKKTEECLQLVANIFSKKNPSFVLWLKDGKDVPYDHDKKIVRKDSNQKMTILYVHDIGKEDEGEYTIAVTNSTGGCVEKKLRFELPKGNFQIMYMLLIRIDIITCSIYKWEK